MKFLRLSIFPKILITMLFVAAAIDRMGTSIRIAIERLSANRPSAAAPQNEAQRRAGG